MTARAEVAEHPAKFSDPILAAVRKLAEKHDLLDTKTVLDPFVGVGKVFEVFPQAVGVELLPRWAKADKRIIQGNSLYLRKIFPRKRFKLVVTSPCYGTRMADHHNNKDSCKACAGTGHSDWWVEPLDDEWEWVWYDANSPPCKTCRGTKLSRRHTYFHYHGPDGWVEEDNAGAMQWGPQYRIFYAQAWASVWDVMENDSDLILNVSDHYRDFERQPVEQFHLDVLADIGFTKVETKRVKTQRQKHGQNYQARVPTEGVHLLHKAA
jgi:DNA modification methylase